MQTPTLKVVGAIFVHAQSVLAFRRASHKASGGKWEFPGGKLEPGETYEAALRREIREELRIEVSVGEFVYESLSEIGPLRISLACFYVIGPTREIVLGNDHSEHKWVNVGSSLVLDWAAPDIPVVEHLIRTMTANPSGE